MAKLIMTEEQIKFSGTRMDQIVFYVLFMIEEFGLSMVEEMLRDAQGVDSVKVEEL